MKVAVCLSGFMRCYKATFPSLSHLLLKPLQVDLFISTWDVAGHSYRHWSNGKEPEEHIFAKNLKEVYGEHLKGLNIVPLDIEKTTPNWIKAMKGSVQARTMMRRVTSMYYHLNKANALKKSYERVNRLKYDVVIRLRSDLLFKYPLLPWITEGDFRPGLVHTSVYERYGILNDQFMYGDSKTMDRVAGIYKAIRNRSPDILPPHHGYCPFTPAEGLLRHFLNWHKIEYKEHHIVYSR